MLDGLMQSHIRPFQSPHPPIIITAATAAVHAVGIAPNGSIYVADRDGRRDRPGLRVFADLHNEGRDLGEFHRAHEAERRRDGIHHALPDTDRRAAEEVLPAQLHLRVAVERADLGLQPDLDLVVLGLCLPLEALPPSLVRLAVGPALLLILVSAPFVYLLAGPRGREVTSPG